MGLLSQPVTFVWSYKIITPYL